QFASLFPRCCLIESTHRISSQSVGGWYSYVVAASVLPSRLKAREVTSPLPVLNVARGFGSSAERQGTAINRRLRAFGSGSLMGYSLSRRVGSAHPTPHVSARTSFGQLRPSAKS